MAIKFAESFGHYGAVGATFSSINNVFDTGWVLQTSGSTSITFGAGFSTGGMAVYMSRATNGSSRIERQFTTEEDTFIVGFQFKATARGEIFRIPGVLAIEWPDRMGIDGTYGTATPILNTGYYVELKITKSTGAVDFHLNGYPYLTTTVAGGIPDTVTLSFGYGTSGPSANVAVSNVVLVDSSAGRYTDFIGPQIATSDKPTASVSPVTWDPVPSNLTNVQIMNNLPPNVNQYTQSDVIGSKDFYTSSTAVAGTVTAVMVTALIGKTDIDDQTIKVGISDGGTSSESPDIPVLVQPTYVQHVFEDDVAGGEWTQVTAQAVQFGVTIQPRD